MSERLSPLALQTRLASVTVVDVRQPMEVAGGRIPGSRCIPLDRIDRAELPEGDLVLVCQSGNRSGQAAALVERRWPGRTVLDLEGGLEGWQQAGLPVERQAGAPLPLMRQVQIADGMSERKFGEILAVMEINDAATLTELMASRGDLPETLDELEARLAEES